MSAGHIRQRSPGSWEIKYDLRADPVTGKRRTRTTTVKGSKRDAQAELRRLLGQVDQGAHVAPGKLTTKEHVRRRIDHWRASGRIETRAAENYEDLLHLINEGVGPVPLQALTMGTIEGWHVGLRKRGLKPRTIRAAHVLLARVLGEAVKHQLIVRNVARDQGLPVKLSGDAVLAPNAEAVQRLLVNLADGDPWRVPVIVALYTGLRRSEQLALRWANVDLEQARLAVVEALDETRAGGVAVKPPKTEAGRRTISLPSIVVEALREHRRQQLEQRVLLGQGRPSDDALVFPAVDGGRQSPRSFSVRWGRVAARLMAPEITWHMLRHAHASMLIGAGVPITVVAARLGHANPSVTLSVYARMFSKDDQQAADALEEIRFR
jgi:integrase